MCYRRFVLIILTGPLLLLGVQPALGSLLVYEPFDYLPGPLNGGASGIGFSTAWSASNQFLIQSGSLDFPGFAASGNKAQYNIGPSSAFANRMLSMTFGADGTDLWESFRIQVTSTPFFASLETGHFSSNGLHIGQLGGGGPGGSTPPLSNWGMDTSGGSGQVLSQIPVVLGQTALLVAHLQFLPGPDHIDLYVNPTTNLAPVAPDATKTDLDLGTFNEIDLAVFGGNVLYDEIRMGTTYQDVAPVPEPPPIMLGILGGILMLVLRPRRGARYHRPYGDRLR